MKQADKTTRAPKAGTPMPFADIVGLNGGLFEAYVKTGQAFLDNTFALNQELMRFAGERFQADITALKTLSQCKNWQDIANLQADFVRSATEAYQAEIPELVKQNMAVATASWQSLYQSLEASRERQDHG